MSEKTDLSDVAQAIRESQHEIPEEVPLLVNTQFVLFPFMIAPLLITEERDMRKIDDVVQGTRMIGIFAPRTADGAAADGDDGGPREESAPAETDELAAINDIGTVAMVLRMLRIPDGTLRLLVHGVQRVRVVEKLADGPYPRVKIEPVSEVTVDDNETQALKNLVREHLTKIVEASHSLPGDLITAANNVEDPGRLADMIASNLNLKLHEQQEILEILDTKLRLLRVQRIMNRELEIARIGSKIQTEVKTNIDRMQRDYFLREQLKAIRRELGEGEDGGNELDEVEQAIEAAGMPEYALKTATKELGRLRSMSPASAEYTVSRTYVDWLVSLPWNKRTEDNIDLEHARQILDEDHYDLEKVKDRILEYLAVIKLRKAIRGPILCLVGPPGVGKTSLGRSVARAMGRRFVRISLGGVRDEAEIRGHRRTYIDSMPGRIIKSLKEADSNNPVFMLDEIDKLGMDFRGDPASALLEVLDPEQNSTFSDHYLDMPFDLSNVMFITTANTLDSIPGPLLDRMEVLRLSGYTLREKVKIARRYLIPRALENSGLSDRHVTFHDDALEQIIENYTREAGLRNLEREITNICRKAARAIAEKKRRKVRVDARHVVDALGPARFERDLLDNRTREPGVVVGLAWTPTGGDILFLEATATRGSGKLTLTGKLGDVMQESVKAARTYLHAHADQFGLKEEQFSEQDLHVHVPAGAIPKDGPSAGVAMMTALASLLRGQPVAERLAMTGEITLKGAVLPVGGIKEKVLAAHRSGVQTLILPQRNEKDLVDVPAEVRQALTIHFVSTAQEVLDVALPGAEGTHRSRASRARKPAQPRPKNSRGVARRNGNGDRPGPAPAHARRNDRGGRE